MVTQEAHNLQLSVRIRLPQQIKRRHFLSVGVCEIGILFKKLFICVILCFVAYIYVGVA